jgi:hypothetical protein
MQIGVQTMERSINLQIHETATAPVRSSDISADFLSTILANYFVNGLQSTFLSAQRAEQERRLNPAFGGGTPTTTPIR